MSFSPWRLEPATELEEAEQLAAALAASLRLGPGPARRPVSVSAGPAAAVAPRSLAAEPEQEEVAVPIVFAVVLAGVCHPVLTARAGAPTPSTPFLAGSGRPRHASGPGGSTSSSAEPAHSAAAHLGLPLPRRRFSAWSLTPALEDELGGRAYAVWCCPGAATDLRGLHAGAGAWGRLLLYLRGRAYQTGRDRLRGYDSFLRLTRDTLLRLRATVRLGCLPSSCGKDGCRRGRRSWRHRGKSAASLVVGA